MGNFVTVSTDEPLEVSKLPPDLLALADIRRVLDHAYAESDEQDAADLIHAFYKIRWATSLSCVCMEIYLDPDKDSDMWEFVWSSEENPPGLPLSPHGSPACAHWPASQVARWHDLLKTGQQPEVQEFLPVLAYARQHGHGVFVFFEE